VQRARRFVLFSGLLLLAAYLRVVGLTWALNSGYGHERNFQPDEFVSLRGVLQVDLLTGHIKAPGAYFEGTFNYYLWAVPQALLKFRTSNAAYPSDSTITTDHSDLLYIGRWMSVLFDLCTVVFVFLAIREATGRFCPSLLGALCYAVLPMQVIYAHFMRTHTLSNLLCALVIWLSLKLRKSPRWSLLLGVGFISGLAGATRYPVGLIGVIPCLYLLFDSGISADSKLHLWERVRMFVASQAWLIALGFGGGLFLGNPMLFFDSSAVAKAISGETLKYASVQQFHTAQLLNLSHVWRYITYLIPFAMYPYLWLLPYLAIVYVIFSRHLYSQCLPILIFSVLYLYFMAKGYLGPYFARATMLLFPGFCVLCGVACSDLRLRFMKKPTAALILTAAFLVVLVPSIFFDVSYGRAMQQKDARLLVREDLQKLIGDGPATIGVARVGAYFYTAMPAAEPLKSDWITVQLQDAGEKADFFVLGFPRQMDAAYLKAIIRNVEGQGQFKFEKSYRVPLMMLGHEFSLRRFPPDMTYPFPTILLFRARAPA
jgi:hypothetical protein